MLQLDDLEKVWSLHRERVLKPSDIGTLMAVIGALSWQTGKAEITSVEIGEQLGTDPRLVRNSLSRLKKHGLVRMFREGTGFFYSVHPSLVRAGRGDSRNILVARWLEDDNA